MTSLQKHAEQSEKTALYQMNVSSSGFVEHGLWRENIARKIISSNLIPRGPGNSPEFRILPTTPSCCPPQKKHFPNPIFFKIISDNDEPLLSGSGAVSKEVTNEELLENLNLFHPPPKKKMFS